MFPTKLLKRNLKSFAYCPYVGMEDTYDEYGNKGSPRASYGDAVTVQGNISASTGQAQVEMFGNADYYSKVILVDDMSCLMDENSVLFVDKDPAYDDSGYPLFDYVVKRVATYLDVKAYAIEKVTVS